MAKVNIKVDKYKEDGVDIGAEAIFSRYCAGINASTANVSQFVKTFDLSRGNFRGPKGFRLQKLPRGWIQTTEVDGIGTKVVLVVAANKPRLAPSNLLDMTAMDITRWGGIPLVLSNCFDVRSLGEPDSGLFCFYMEAMAELGDLAKYHCYVLQTGETAQLGACVGSEIPDAKAMFNWAGFMIGAYHPKKMILGDKLKPGQVIMVLKDFFRSNGISSVRKALAMRYGSAWWNNPDAYDDIVASATSSVHYDRFFNYIHGWYNFGNQLKPMIDVKLIVHLSGGAFKEKLGEDMLTRLNLSAELTDLFAPPPIMTKCGQWRGLSKEEFYRAWNGGQGALAVIDEQDIMSFIKIAAQHGIESKVAGRILKKQDYNVAIKPQYGDGEMIYY